MKTKHKFNTPWYVLKLVYIFNIFADTKIFENDQKHLIKIFPKKLRGSHIYIN